MLPPVRRSGRHYDARVGKSQAPDPLSQALSRLKSAGDPLAAVDASRELRELADAAELDRVRAARQAGIAWSRIGKVYGLTKQGAQQRFRSALERADDEAQAK